MMPPNFRQVTPHLYRSGAPVTQSQVDWLVNNYPQIRKIISLDNDTGRALSRFLPPFVEHIQLPMYPNDPANVQTVGNKLKEMGGKIFDTPEGSTLVHCRHGQDRTGFAIAIYDIIRKGMSPQAAIRNAEALGYGRGLSEKAKQMMNNVVGVPTLDSSPADDIVSKVREEGHNLGPSSTVADTSMPVMDQTKVWHSALQSPVGDSYPPVNIRSRINRVNNILKKAATKTVVVISGTPYYGAEKFYKELQKFLMSLGYAVEFVGLRDLPPPADIWIGHGRGVQALKAAPSTVRTLALRPALELTPEIRSMIRALGKDHDDINDAFLGGGPQGSPTAEQLPSGQAIPTVPHLPESGMRSNYQGSIPGTNMGASPGTPGAGGPGGIVDVDPYSLVQL